MERRWILAAGVALASVVAGVWWGRGVQPTPDLPRAPITATTFAPTAGTGAETIVVHVSGWVASPGLVAIPSGGRIGDALAAAGGVRPGASLDNINLAQVLGDGQQVLVPGPGDSTAAGNEVLASEAPAEGPIHLNSATASQLEGLPGVGPVLAERIVAHREDTGPFQQVEDLLEVSGIGEAKLASIRDLVTVP